MGVPPTPRSGAVASRVAPFAPWALALVAAATFARGIGYGFVFDDIIVLCKSERIRELSSAYEVFVRPSQWIISDAANSRLMTYRPLALGSMVLEFVAFGGAPWIFHLTNVALHVACVVLFWRLLIDTNTSAATSFALALLFAVHPVGSEAITWINGRSEPICLLFGLVVLSLCTRAPPLTALRFAAPCDHASVPSAHRLFGQDSGTGSSTNQIAQSSVPSSGCGDREHPTLSDYCGQIIAPE